MSNDNQDNTIIACAMFFITLLIAVIGAYSIGNSAVFEDCRNMGHANRGGVVMDCTVRHVAGI